MNLSLGIVGLPNVGKSSLFSELTNLNAFSANYPFATAELILKDLETIGIRISDTQYKLKSKRDAKNI